MTNDQRDAYRTIIVFAVIVVIAAVVSSGTSLQPGNIHNLIQQNLIICLLAIAQFYVVLNGGIDLSLAAIAALSTVVVVLLQDYGLLVACLGAIGTGLTIGLVNGLLVTLLKLPAFLVTLGTMQITYSLAKAVSGGGTVRNGAAGAEISPSLLGLYDDAPLGLSNALVLVLVVIGASMLFFRTSVGHFLYQIGANPRAAHNAGIRVAPHQVASYVIAGGLAALAGCLFVSRVGYGDPQAGGLVLILDAIAAVTVGGASLFGGAGSVLATVVGVLIIGVVNNLLNVIGIPATLQPTIKGIVILCAVYVYTQSVSSKGGGLSGWLRDAAAKFVPSMSRRKR